jgi:hypothetical protein
VQLIVVVVDDGDDDDGCIDIATPVRASATVLLDAGD